MQPSHSPVVNGYIVTLIGLLILGYYEDAQLDFLIFLSEKRGRAELFKLESADGNA